MIYLNFVAVGRRCSNGEAAVAADRPYILESTWNSEPLLKHFLMLLGLEGIPSESVRLDTERFDVEGLERMTTICGDHAKLIESLLVLRTSKFALFVAQSLVTRSSRDSSPNDVVPLPGTRCKPALEQRLV